MPGVESEERVDALDELRSLMLEMRSDMRELRGSLEELRRELRGLSSEDDSSSPGAR